MTIKSTFKSLSKLAVLVIVGGAGWYAWQTLQPTSFAEQLPDSVAYGNGRIEATEYDIATKLPGRLVDVMVQEGDMVKAGQTLAVIDTDDLNAQLREAQAGLRVANESRKYALAIVEQHKSELNFAQTELRRSLVVRGRLRLFPSKVRLCTPPRNPLSCLMPCRSMAAANWRVSRLPTKPMARSMRTDRTPFCCVTR